MEVITNISELAENWDYYFFEAEKYIAPDYDNPITHKYGVPKGFTIGRGKKLYSLITVQPLGFYYAYPMDERGMLGWRRQIETGTKITIYYDKLANKK